MSELPTRLLVVSLTVLITLAGCSQTDHDPTSNMPSNGAASSTLASSPVQCYQEGSVAGVNFGSAVDCHTPHTTETFASLEMPQETIQVDLAAYQPNSTLYLKWSSWASPACLRAHQDITGTAGWARAIGGDPKTSPVYPAFAGAVAFTLSPRWMQGEHRTVCFATTTHSVGQPFATTIGSARMPVDLASCSRQRSAQPDEPVSCHEPHYRQHVFSFDAVALLGERSLRWLNPTRLNDTTLAELDRRCASARTVVLGANRADITVRAVVDYQQWSHATTTARLVQCTADITDPSQNVMGSVIGIGEKELVTVPAD